ncbi:T9SS type A sorting domain-containing protein [Niabella ginsengisoli]|uniref:T9SS type A sorting domain-containing protein n=1 Tax=Niabella ginsengisoli TaxID=522298 RepID=A0ABS9SHW2_9BACT|nr:T9SS type A sorting domain-containing protein [Niabella ginsengisoli]MCH5597967.1 T9SS type A sorting domain-containing protein [Niabella ginsengisoli]
MPTDNTILTDQPREFSSTFKEFPASVYSWEFSFDQTNWYKLPSQFQGKHTFSASAADILRGSPFDVNSQIGKNVLLRLNPCNSNNQASNVVVYTIKHPTPEITNLTPQPAKCFGSNDGAVNFNLSRALLSNETIDVTLYKVDEFGTTPEGSFVITPSSSVPYKVSNLAAGTYSIKIISKINGGSSNQVSSNQFTIAAPTKGSFSGSTTNVLCYGNADGTITLNASGGSGGYEYMIRRAGESDSTWHAFSGANQHTITGLTAQTWQVKLRDANGCAAQEATSGYEIKAYTITQPEGSLSTQLVALQHPTGYQLADGSIEVKISGGTPKADGSYTYEVRDSATNNLITAGFTGAVTTDGYLLKLSDVKKGTYLFKIGDQNSEASGCYSESKYRLSKSPPRLNDKVTVTDADCFDSKTALKVQLDRALQTGEVLQVQAVDAANNRDVLLGEIKEGDPDASLTYTFQHLLPSGTYKLHYKGVLNGSESEEFTTGSFIVSTPSSVGFSISEINNVRCFSGQDGSFKINASGGSGPYMYMVKRTGYADSTWYNLPTDNVVSSLSAGDWQVYLRDENGCAVKDPATGAVMYQTVTITQPPTGMAASVMSLTHPSAYSSSDGSIEVVISGGTPKPDGSYDFQVTNKATGAIINTGITASVVSNGYKIKVSGLANGAYGLTSSDAGGASDCSVNSVYQLEKSPPGITDFLLTNPKCTDGNSTIKVTLNKSLLANEKLVLLAKDSVSGDETQLKEIGNTDLDANRSYTAEYALPAAGYQLLYYGIENGNESARFNAGRFTVKPPAPVSFTADSTNVTCFGKADGTITLNANGGMGKYQYMIKRNGQTDSTWQDFSAASSHTIIGLAPGSWVVALRDGNQCVAKTSDGQPQTRTIQITQPDKAITNTLVKIIYPNGYGSADGSIEVEVTGGVPKADGSYNYQWTDSLSGTVITSGITTSNAPTGFRIKISGLREGVYTLKTTDAISTSCEALSTYELKNNPPKIVSLMAESPKCKDAAASLKITVDRLLLDGEELVVTAVDSLSGASYPMGSLAAADFDASKSHLFTHKLKAGMYYLSYKALLNNTESAEVRSSSFEITAPTPVTFSAENTNVSCFQGADATVTVTAAGGEGGYQYFIGKENQTDSAWVAFTSGNTHTITGLAAGKWYLQIRDKNSCYARTADNSEVKTIVIDITQPTDSLSATLIKATNTTRYEGSDGSLEVTIKGGTPEAGGSYKYEWKNADGVAITQGSTATAANNSFTIKLTNLKAGFYTLTATDDKGCMLSRVYEVDQPDPLTVRFELLKAIACNGSANGSIVAHGAGGVPFASGYPYKYTWKQADSLGNYTELPNRDSVLTNISSGWYAVNITDANDVVLAKDSLYYLPQPAALKLSFSIIDNSYEGETNGSVTATATGGVGPYTYMWNTGATGATVSNLPEGLYFVVVTDKNNCQAQQNVFIKEPKTLKVTTRKKHPGCYNSCDGALEYEVSGGTAPYTYEWTGTGATSAKADALCAGYYKVLITDAAGKDITIYDTLYNPQPIPLTLGKDRYICLGQQIDMDIAIAGFGNISYSWMGPGGFSSSLAKVTLSQAGTYYVKATNSNGCDARDTLVLTASNITIANEFALPTQVFAGEPIVVVNTSNPAPDSVRWILPREASVHKKGNESAEFVLPTGLYEVTLITYKGMCAAEQTKKLAVAPRSELEDVGKTRNPFVKVFSMNPNPNNGNFTVKVELETKASVQLKMFDVENNKVYSITYRSGAASYTIPVSMSLAKGTYVLLLETPKGSENLKVIIL